MRLLLFNACAKLVDADSIHLGIRVLNELPATALADRPLTTSAVDMLMKFGQVKKAEDIFARVKTPDVSIYGAMMQGYNYNDQPQSTLELFDRMKQRRLTPNLQLSLALIKASALIGMRPICESIVKQIPSQHQEDHRSKNALIDMWVSRSVSVWSDFISKNGSFQEQSVGRGGSLKSVSIDFSTRYDQLHHDE